MKKFSTLTWFAVIAFVLTMATGCSKENDSSLSDRGNDQSLVYPPNSQPYGKSYEEWIQAFWDQGLALNCETFFQDHIFELHPNVVSLFGSLGGGDRTITISRNQSLFLPLLTSVFDHPCPDPDYGPEEGQTLEEFLQAGFSSFIFDVTETMEATLDGEPIDNILEEYDFLTDLYYFTGNPELTSCVDPCITGEPQAAVSGGYILMFKKMSPGTHVVTMHGEIPSESFEWDVTIHVIVE